MDKAIFPFAGKRLRAMEACGEVVPGGGTGTGTTSAKGLRVWIRGGLCGNHPQGWEVKNKELDRRAQPGIQVTANGLCALPAQHRPQRDGLYAFRQCKAMQAGMDP